MRRTRCCVSKARAPPAFVDEGLRAELGALRLSELRKRARESGVEEEVLEDATDADEPKQAVIAILLERSRSRGPDARDALAQELAGLRLKELRQRAREQDVSPEEMEAAADSDEPKAAMVELLLRKAQA